MTPSTSSVSVLAEFNCSLFLLLFFVNQLLRTHDGRKGKEVWIDDGWRVGGGGGGALSRVEWVIAKNSNPTERLEMIYKCHTWKTLKLTEFQRGKR